jgi:heme o synthase
LQYFRIFFKLTKVIVSSSVSITAFTGYILAGGKFDYKLGFTILGIYLLSSGASVLNQVQESRTDALMPRTKSRPIPSGEISRNSALAISLVLIVGGSLILYFQAPFLCVVLGLFNVFWYNVVYTSLKFKTAFAIIPGALSGVIPVLIAWVATGASVFDPKVILIGFFLYLWQIPHFWLLILRYGKEYEAAGLSSLSSLLSEDKMKNLIFVWLLASIIMALYLPYFDIVQHPVIVIIFAILNIWLMIYFSLSIIFRKIQFSFRPAFIQINVFQVLIMLLLIIDKLIQ